MMAIRKTELESNRSKWDILPSTENGWIEANQFLLSFSRLNIGNLLFPTRNRSFVINEHAVFTIALATFRHIRFLGFRWEFLHTDIYISGHYSNITNEYVQPVKSVYKSLLVSSINPLLAQRVFRQETVFWRFWHPARIH